LRHCGCGLQNAVYYAYYPPYTYERHQDLIAEMQTREGCELEMLGETLDGHDLDLLRVGKGPMFCAYA
jgi:hypothetical protein